MNCNNRTRSRVLHKAVENNNIEELKALIKKGHDVNIKGYLQRTALHVAIEKHRNKEIIQLLLDHGADVNARDGKYMSPLNICAMENDSEKIAEILLENDADPYIADNLGITPLIRAIEKNNIKLVKSFLKNSCDPTQKRYNGKVPIFCAVDARSDNVEMLKLLMMYGANLSEKTIFDENLFHWAARKPGNTKIMDILLAYWLDINAQDDYGETPLHMISAAENNSENLKFLLKHGADVNIRNYKDETPLFYALAVGNEKYVEIFLDAGADLHFSSTLIRNLINVNDINIKNWNAIYFFVKHLIKLKMLNLLNEQIYKDWKSMIVDKSEDLKIVEAVCKKEADSMQNELVCSSHNIKFSDILTKELRKVAGYLNVEEIKEELSRVNFDEKFPYYSKMMEKRIKESRNLAEMLRKSYEKLQLILENKKLPDTFVIETLKYLNEKDVKHLVNLS